MFEELEDEEKIVIGGGVGGYANRRRYGYSRDSSSGICIYCGGASECWDHLWPASSTFLPPMGMGRLVEACNECNLIASNRLFGSIEEKREYIQDALRSKSKNILRGSGWDEEELEELGYTLRSAVEEGEYKKRFVEIRVSFKGEKESEGELSEDMIASSGEIIGRFVEGQEDGVWCCSLILEVERIGWSGESMVLK